MNLRPIFGRFFLKITQVPYAIIAFLFSDRPTWREILWTYSEYIEAFVMVPQYVFQYRSERKETIKSHPMILFWITCIGFYRILYFMNWVWKKANNMPVPEHSIIGGGVQILFFIDFLVFYGGNVSCLRAVTLFFDDKVNDIGDGMELAVGAAMGLYYV